MYMNWSKYNFNADIKIIFQTDFMNKNIIQAVAYSAKFIHIR